MNRIIAWVLVGGLLVGVTGCAASGEASEPVESASGSAGLSASQNEDAGVCHSVSMALTVLEDAQRAYADTTLDRESFDVVASSGAESFKLLRVMHGTVGPIQAAEDLGSAVGNLATAEEEPATNDVSDFGQKRSALAAECDAIGASLSIYQ